MENRQSIKNLMSNQQDLRHAFYEVLRKNPQSLSKAAKQIGISPMTLINFVKNEKDVDTERALKIDKWIIECLALQQKDKKLIHEG